MQETIHQDNRQQELLERSQIKAGLRIKVAHRTSARQWQRFCAHESTGGIRDIAPLILNFGTAKR